MTIHFANQCNIKMYENLGIDLKNERGCTYGATLAPTPLLNGVISCNIDASCAVEIVDKITDYFAKKELPHSWWLEESYISPELKKALVNKGMQMQGVFPCMYLSLDQINRPNNSSDIEIRPIETKKELLELIKIVAEVFQFSDATVKIYSHLFESAGLEGPFFHMIGKKEGKIVAAGTVLCTPKGAYLYNVATVETERNKGYSSNLCSRLLDLAKNNSCMQAALVSSPQAINIYKQLGFQLVSNYHIYL